MIERARERETGRKFIYRKKSDRRQKNIIEAFKIQNNFTFHVVIDLPTL